jgi:hypothetical protein
MALFHSLVMSGGLLDAIESQPTDHLAHAVAGYRYFGLGAAADFVEWVARQVAQRRDDPDAMDELEVEADRRYPEPVPNDSVLVQHFEGLLGERPDTFAPVTQQRV